MKNTPAWADAWRPLPMAAPEICPHCGALVPPDAVCCPECGSDENTGWSDKAAADRLGIPDDDFDYEEYIREEFGEKPSIKPSGVRWHWWLVALGLLILFAWFFLRMMLRS